MADAVLDAFIDSLKVLAVVAVCTYIIALIEPILAKKIRLHGKLAPLIGVSVSLLPQCGFSVVAADLYRKRHITLGTLIGVFLATSDEALPVFLSYPEKALHVLPIIAIKFLLGLLIGYLIDFIFTKSRKSVNHHVKHCGEQYRIRLMHCEEAERIETPARIKETCTCKECSSSSCSELKQQTHTHIDKKGILFDYLTSLNKKNDKKSKIDRFLIKPFLHSVEIFIYVLIINIAFSLIIFSIGEDKIISFLLTNKSIIISELYIFGGLGFGATLGGLCMNAGLGFMYLFKDTKRFKNNILIFILMFFISIIISYIFSIIFSFSSPSF